MHASAARRSPAGIIQGQLDTLLNAKGEDQAQLTATALRTEQVTRILSSPLQRAFRTAEAIAAHHPGAVLEANELLKERAFGVLEGNVYRGPANKPEDTVGIESTRALADRLSQFWAQLQRDLEADPEKNACVVLVSHGAALSALLNHVLLAEGHAVRASHVAPSRLWNCSVSEVVVPAAHGKVAEIVRWADVAHLDVAKPGTNVPLRNVDESI